MRFQMHRRTEQKEDGRLIHYYTFTPLNDESEPVDSSPATQPDSQQPSPPRCLGVPPQPLKPAEDASPQ